MDSISNFFRNYHFLDFTQSIAKNKIDVCKKPDTTWGEFGSNFRDVCLYNLGSFVAVGADVAMYLSVTAFREMGLFLPLPPPPPVFPSPRDNVEFIHNAIQRAVWDWLPSMTKLMHEGIQDGISDTWNVYQVVGEWALAYSLENGKKGDSFKPNFLRISEGLADGETFMSVGIAFDKLNEKDQRQILSDIYHQSEPSQLSAAGKKVHLNIRALASLLHQGNRNYLESFDGYQKKREAGKLRTLLPMAEIVLAPERVTANTVTKPAIQNVYTGTIATTTPPTTHAQANKSGTLSEIHFFNQAISAISSPNKKEIVQAIVKDRSEPLAKGNHPETLVGCAHDASLKYFIARLGMLRMLKESFQKNRPANCPSFFPWNEKLQNGQDLREVGQRFVNLTDNDYRLLEGAIIDPTGQVLQGTLRERLLELSEFAELLHRDKSFLKMYEALKVDLVAR